MKVYLDNCCLQRPVDDKSQILVRIEAEAVLGIIELIEQGVLELITSAVLELELKKALDPERILYREKVLSLHSKRVELSDEIIRRAKEFEKKNIVPVDALHLAVADCEKADFFCTSDHRFLKRAKKIKGLHTKVVSPTELIEEIEK